MHFYESCKQSPWESTQGIHFYLFLVVATKTHVFSYIFNRVENSPHGKAFEDFLFTCFSFAARKNRVFYAFLRELKIVPMGKRSGHHFLRVFRLSQCKICFSCIFTRVENSPNGKAPGACIFTCFSFTARKNPVFFMHFQEN